ncbi:MAG: 4Fe-4S binding protein, partial [Bacteroidetes bacterium]|nr:4Fe-4S binding protein [Bacteroidota bacterium]
MKKSNKRNLNYLRLTFQWSALVLLAYMVVRLFADKDYIADFEAYCPFGGIQALSSYLVTNTLACTMTSLQIAMGLALITGVVIFSKLFCAYICPLGTFTEWIGLTGEKFKVRFTIKGFADRALRTFKYVLLFITFYFTIETSELFCKKFDPYYAAFSGFSSDVNITFAITAIILLVFGSLFIRQAWCKYLCPLGAITNIFANFILFILLIGIYLILIMVFKFHISWIWLLSAITVLSFLNEVLLLKFNIFPILKVTRNPDKCTLCRKCDKVCPLAIKVTDSVKVKHIDCHLCCDCINECPEKNVLQINKKNLRWLPPAAIILLTVTAIWLSSVTEIPTISEQWGTKQQKENAGIYLQHGLKNIKCYGSSVSFAEQMKKLKGVIGIETYVSSKTVKVFYDPSIVNSEKIKEAIFSPSAVILNEPSENKIGVAELKIENYFDTYDEYYFTSLLSANPDIYAFSTTFGEPVNGKIYFNPQKLKISKIIKIIESPEIKIKDDETENIQKLNFKVKHANENPTIISLQDFFMDMIKPMDDKFNKFSTYKPNELSIYKINLPIFNKEISENLLFLESHLSNNDGIVGFKTIYNKAG